MKPIMEKLEHLLQLGGIKKDILFLVLSGIAIVCSLLGLSPFPFDYGMDRHHLVRCPLSS